MSIDPGFLEELDGFDVALERPTTALRQGDKRSPRVGEGLTFSDYRRYSPGDDTRLVDWKLFARTEEYFVKQFEEERSLTVHLLVDASASMDYGDGDADKFDYAAKLALGLAYLTAGNNDDYRFSTFRDSPDRLDTGSSTRGDLLGIIDELNAATPSGEAAFGAALPAYADRIRSRSLVVVVSDCLADPDVVETGVAALARTGADVLLVRVLAPGERDPEAAGDVLFADPESDATRRSYFSRSLADTYRSRLDAHVDAVADRARTLGGEHVLVDTGADYLDSFARVWLA